MNNLAASILKQGRAAEAEALYRQALERRRRVSGEKHPDTLKLMNNLALTLIQQNKDSDALPLCEELYRSAPATQGDPKLTAQYISAYGQCLVRLKRFTDAEVPLREAWKQLEQTDQRSGVRARGVLLGLAETCEATGRRDEAKMWRDRAETLQPATRLNLSKSIRPATAPSP
jgi:tetratricopeptide (TPR) repeat protein